MPKKGSQSVTIPQKHYDKLTRLKKKKKYRQLSRAGIVQRWIEDEK